MVLLPIPQRLKLHTERFTLTPQTEIVLRNGPLLFAQMLRQSIEAHTGLRLPIRRGQAFAGSIVLGTQPFGSEKYTLTVTENGAEVSGSSEAMLCHGVQTLRQIAQTEGARWPALAIDDYPDLPNRGYYLDSSRGRVQTLDALKRTVDLLCQYKINQFQLYVEHTYLFRGLSEAWRDDTPFTAEEIMELDDYCHARHIELVPSLSTFGHMHKILSTKTYSDLCELSDSEKDPLRFVLSHRRHTLNVSNPDSLPFVQSLISEYQALFRSCKFNICADETFDLGKGRSKALADEHGERALYLRHVKALCEWLVAQGITPQFWGDIMWRFPDACKELPKETVCLNWGYLPDQREDEIRTIAETGITQYACPGVCGWNRWVPLYHNAYRNNAAMSRHARKYHATGLLNTDWGDLGHINDPRLSEPGILYGAAFAWNASAPDEADINRMISRLLYQDLSGTMMDIMLSLCDHEVFDWYHAVMWIEAPHSRGEYTREGVLAAIDTAAVPAANQAISDALERLAGIALSLSPRQNSIVRVLWIAAEGARIFNEIALHLHTPADGSALACRLERWYYDFCLLWRENSKETRLDRLTQIITAYGDVLRGRERKE